MRISLMNASTPWLSKRELADITGNNIHGHLAAGEVDSNPTGEVSILVKLRREKYASSKQAPGVVVYECGAGGAHSGQRRGSATRRPEPRKTPKSRGRGGRHPTPRISTTGRTR